MAGNRPWTSDVLIEARGRQDSGSAVRGRALAAFTTRLKIVTIPVLGGLHHEHPGKVESLDVTA